MPSILALRSSETGNYMPFVLLKNHAELDANRHRFQLARERTVRNRWLIAFVLLVLLGAWLW
jgi:hypothetical protein